MNCQILSADTSELTKQKLEILLRHFFNENMTQLDILRFLNRKTKYFIFKAVFCLFFQCFVKVAGSMDTKISMR